MRSQADFSKRRLARCLVAASLSSATAAAQTPRASDEPPAAPAQNPPPSTSDETNTAPGTVPVPAPVAPTPAAPAPARGQTPAPGQAAVINNPPGYVAPVQPSPYGPGPYGPPGYPPTPYYVEPPPPEDPWPDGPSPAFKRHKLSVQTEAVFSADEGPFYNHLAGARYDFHTSRATSLGAYVGYANLKGIRQRVHSALLLGQFEYHFYFGSEQRLIIPLRAGLGYLIENGPMVRFATGVHYQVTDDFEMGLDFIAPTFWTAHDDTVISMNLALEVGMAF